MNFLGCRFSPRLLLHWHSGICFNTVHTLLWRFFFGTMHSEYMYVVCSQHQLIRGDVYCISYASALRSHRKRKSRQNKPIVLIIANLLWHSAEIIIDIVNQSTFTGMEYVHCHFWGFLPTIPMNCNYLIGDFMANWILRSLKGWIQLL